MLKTASVFLVIGLIFSGIYALVMVVSPKTVGGSTLEARSQLQLADVQPGAADAILIQTRHIGVFGLALTIALFFILFNAFNKGQAWAWWAFLLVGIFVWGYGIVLQALEGDVLNLIGHAIGIVLIFLGLMIPFKVFFPKKAA
jgi:hypothetical protein